MRSGRIGRKVIQQTVAHLGELDAQGRARARALAQALIGGRTQPELVTREAAEEAVVSVRLDRVRLERGRSFGDVWLGWTLGRAVRRDTAWEALRPAGREAVPVDRVTDDRLYRAVDRGLPHKRAIEPPLVPRLGELFALDDELLRYDVTRTSFEGQAAANPLAQRGSSRAHRPDGTQGWIAFVGTRTGLPLGYEVFAGNRTDVTTGEDSVGTMEARYGVAQRIWGMDRGMTSEENLVWLRARGRRSRLGPPKSELRKWAQAGTDKRAWTTVRAGGGR